MENTKFYLTGDSLLIFFFSDGDSKIVNIAAFIKVKVMISEETMNCARIIWNYHHMNDSLLKSDCILALGSHDIRVAERAAELYLKGWAPYIVFSGGLGRLTNEIWDVPEADKFAETAKKMGVPGDKIYVENKSTNTGENIIFTKNLLKQLNLDPEFFIVVQKPYMERRSYATFKKIWPEKKLIVTSPQINFENYPNSDISLEQLIHIMVGDLQRIKIYAEKEFQIPQEIPSDVWNAYNQLVDAGFTHELVQ